MDATGGLDGDFDEFASTTGAVSVAKRNARYHAVPPGAGGPFDPGQWTALTKAALERLWDLGYSTAAIGDHIGFSKNAVVGRARRQHLDGRPDPIIRDGRPSPTRQATPRAPSVTLPPLASVAAEIQFTIPRSATAAPLPSRAIRTPIIAGSAVPIERARTEVAPRPYGRIVTCCWPIGEPGTREFHFCDVPSDPGRPYCEEHVKVAYVKVRDLRDQAPA